MNKKPVILPTAIFGGLFLYNIIFWHTTFGLNVLIFSVWIIMAQYLLYKEQFKRLSVWLLTFSAIYSAVCVVMVNSLLTIIMACISLVLLSAFVQAPGLRSVLAAQLHILFNFSKVFLIASEMFISEKGNAHTRKRIFFWLRILVFPVLAASFFILIYSGANDIFEREIGEKVWKYIRKLQQVFDFITIARVFFLLFGFMLISGLIFRFRKWGLIEETEKNLTDNLSHRKPDKLKNRIIHFHSRIRGLKYEYISGAVLFLFLNIVLLILNCIDLKWVWFYWPVHPANSLKEFVHSGVFLLIFSILLASLLILFYFRGNQNFYTKNKWLHILARIWIIQNGFLVISAGLRDVQYINFHGLAWLRLFVLVYLVLSLVGLVTIYFKITQKRTLYWVFRINAWAAFVLLLVLCPMRWDMLIVETNLHHWNKAGIDTYLYLDFTDATLPSRIRDSMLIKSQLEAHRAYKENWINNPSFDEPFRGSFGIQYYEFTRNWQKSGWPSWNYRDYITYKELKKLKAP